MSPRFQRLFSSEEEEKRLKAVEDAPDEVAPEGATGDEAATEGAAGEGTRPELGGGLIPANKLPPAGKALAELFADGPGAETAHSEPARQLEQIATMVAKETAPKKRSIFARLFMPKQPATTSAERPLAGAQASTRDEASAATGTTAIAEPAAEIAEPDRVKAAAEQPEAAIAAADLPSAADEFEKLFSPDPDETSLESVLNAVAESVAEDSQEALVEVPVGDPVGMQVDVTAEISGDPAFDGATGEGFGASNPAQSTDELALGSHAPQKRKAKNSAAKSENNTPQAGSSRVQELDESPASAGTESAHPERSTERPEETPAEDAQDAAQADERPAAPQEAPRRDYREWALDEKLASHREWVESQGRTGKKADLAGAELEAADLISVNLRLADLHDANLRASDLLLADLRDACMVRVDLEESCLVGANLEGANLEGASLETAMGLVPRQFAGANLRDALLPPQLMEFEAVHLFERASKNAFRYFGAMAAASIVSWLVIWKTRDVQLITDSAVIPFLHSHSAAAAMPTAESYLIVPVAIFILYLLFHYHLQRVWDAVLELPAIFPDGHTLGEQGPGIITGLLRTHFRWMNPDPSSTRLVEKGVSLLAAYWIVPVTLLLYWARYLTRQEIHGTVLQVVLVVIATGMAIYGTTKSGRPPERWAIESKWTEWLAAKFTAINAVSVATALGVVLLLLSAGTIAGVPHEVSRAPQYGAANVRRWAPIFFGWLGFDPYADLTEASISSRPPNWNGAEDQIGSVDGLRSNYTKFRYAQAYGAFMANAHLWRADFQGAFLSEADLRGADLGQSNLRYAVMDHAQMNHVNLDRSNLDGADLRRAELRDANLSYCSLTNAILIDARLDGSSLYSARLDSATLTRTNFEKADLRDAFLGGAHMDHADLRNAYLWSAKLPGADMGGAQLEGAILIDANLHGANLGGAQLTGTVLNGADLSGTSLEGADLRGALGLSASQVCSAKARSGVMLDAEMAMEVEERCGT